MNNNNTCETDATRILFSRSLISLALTISFGVAGCGGSDTGNDAVAGSTNTAGGTTPSASPNADLCLGLVADKTPRNLDLGATAKPAPGAAFVDPQFGTTIRRITNAEGRGLQYVKTLYSTVSAWNADESRLLLLRAGYIHELYDGKSYTFIRTVDDINPADGEQVYWDTQDPQVLYYADPTARVFVKYNVETKIKTVLRDFKTAPTSCTDNLNAGNDPMFTSWGSPPIIGLKCGTKRFNYNAATDTVGVITSLPYAEAQQASPDGQLFFQAINSTSAAVYDFNMTELRRLPIEAYEHGGITTTDQGAAFVAVQYAAEGIYSMPLSGAPKKLLYGVANGWPYPPSGTHLSGLAFKQPGWVVASHVGQLPLGRSLLENELVLVNANSGQLCRVAHHRSAAGNASLGYFSEPHPVLSPSGTRIVFASDWGGGATADVYVVELPFYRP